jgi:thioredoxin 1
MANRILCLAFIIIVAFATTACGSKDDSTKTANTSAALSDTTPRITFLELGSVNCIPCKKMQPVMKSLETRYSKQLKVVFHDVLKDKAPAQKYGIKLIPTQIFLDSSGKELMRHEGFYAEAEIDKFLKAQGLTPAN